MVDGTQQADEETDVRRASFDTPQNHVGWALFNTICAAIFTAVSVGMIYENVPHGVVGLPLGLFLLAAFLLELRHALQWWFEENSLLDAVPKP